ncbi:formylglycine-generating enzyme family protein [Pseudomonas folii]|jgi:sulfatase modifying factor 1|uniref:Formylglycine-generating enzyme family protein n=1 Tax=Pseudomonas folii TaxID=2762593 RepID=A0ABR7AUT0_9PSED|nr:formylglycine-generating enzyme family protein [Pseudomonas folii]MBC3948673.1 formylglycine-generating enzyme family protein [Pseudomonas folii]
MVANALDTKRTISITFVTLALAGCDQSIEPTVPAPMNISPAEVQLFISEVKNNFVYVEGGKFLMGDFGAQYGREQAYYDEDNDSKPVHQVELSSFSINRFKVTNSEYQFYLSYNGLSLRDKGAINKKKWDDINSAPNTPAHTDWYEAEKYCKWLASITNQDVLMPTEAQWEYAARSRGQFLAVATNDGTYQAEPRSMLSQTYSPKGINISSNGDRSDFGKKMGWSTEYYSPLPVDMFPPNPLGLYSMSDNGYEWVGDWYDPDYYSYSPEKNPEGPVEPTFKDRFGRFVKVVRGQDVADPYFGQGVNVFRRAEDPFGRFGKAGLIHVDNKTFRCVINSPEPATSSSMNKLDVDSSKLKVRQ